MAINIYYFPQTPGQADQSVVRLDRCYSLASLLNGLPYVFVFNCCDFYSCDDLTTHRWGNIVLYKIDTQSIHVPPLAFVTLKCELESKATKTQRQRGRTIRELNLSYVVQFQMEEKEKFFIVSLCSTRNFEFGHFLLLLLLFCRELQRNISKCRHKCRIIAVLFKNC